MTVASGAEGSSTDPWSQVDDDATRPIYINYGGSTGLSSYFANSNSEATMVIPLADAEQSGSLTGRILAQGWPDSEPEPSGTGTARTLILLILGLGLLLALAMFLLLVAGDAVGNLFGGMLAG
ncbi:MAG TPA: hypothetical protein VIL44_01885 [Micromonospora sp.]